MRITHLSFKPLLILSLLLVAGFGGLGAGVVAYAQSHPRQSPTTVATSPTSPTATMVPPPSPTSAASQSPTQPMQPEVALTFDDGPNPTYTPRILAVLARYGIHATFFCIGKQVQAFPDLVQEEANAGHVIGNHTWDHPDLTKLGPEAITNELSNTSQAEMAITGIHPMFFRPPYGAINATVKAQAHQLGLVPVLWTIDTQDWQRPGTLAIENTVLSQVQDGQDGSIILMHDGGGNRSQTVAALSVIIPQLLQRGVRFVTIARLFADWHDKDVSSVQGGA